MFGNDFAVAVTIDCGRRGPMGYVFTLKMCTGPILKQAERRAAGGDVEVGCAATSNCDPGHAGGKCSYHGFSQLPAA